MPQNKHLTNKMRIKGGAKTPALDDYHAAQKFIVELDEGTPAQYIMENEVFRKEQALKKIEDSESDTNRDGTVKRK